MSYTRFETDHTGHTSECTCAEMPALQLQFERAMTESFCGHLRKSPDLFMKTRDNLLKKSQVKGYESAYFHSQTQHYWNGFRLATEQPKEEA